jgi:hypothetical protein
VLLIGLRKRDEPAAFPAADWTSPRLAPKGSVVIQVMKATFMDYLSFQLILTLVLILLTVAVRAVYTYFQKQPAASQAGPEDWKKQFDQSGEDDDADDFAKFASRDGDVLRGSTETYEWSQSETEMEVWVFLKDVPDSAALRGKDIKVDISLQRLRIQVNGKVITDGELHGMVLVDDCFWQLDEHKGDRVVWITLYKLAPTERNQHWRSVLKGDTEADLSSLGPPVHSVDAQDPAAVRHAIQQVRHSATLHPSPGKRPQQATSNAKRSALTPLSLSLQPLVFYSYAHHGHTNGTR